MPHCYRVYAEMYAKNTMPWINSNIAPWRFVEICCLCTTGIRSGSKTPGPHDIRINTTPGMAETNPDCLEDLLEESESFISSPNSRINIQVSTLPHHHLRVIPIVNSHCPKKVSFLEGRQKFMDLALWWKGSLPEMELTLCTWQVKPTKIEVSYSWILGRYYCTYRCHKEFIYTSLDINIYIYRLHSKEYMS